MSVLLMSGFNNSEANQMFLRYEKVEVHNFTDIKVANGFDTDIFL